MRYQRACFGIVLYNLAGTRLDINVESGIMLIDIE